MSALKSWTSAYAEAAAKEGWGIFESEGKPVILRDDEAALLSSDTTAKMMVRTGTAIHHREARGIIFASNPEEWQLLDEAAASVSKKPDWDKIEAACCVSILENAAPNSLGQIPNALLDKIEVQWIARAATQNFGKPRSQKYLHAEGEFFMGAMTALGQVGFVLPPRWVFAIMQNDNIAKEKK